jgi:hypothetical protein
VDADPVSLALRCTSLMLEETCWVPCAACCTLREIPCVAAPCSSTAAAIVEEISDSLSMVPDVDMNVPQSGDVEAVGTRIGFKGVARA